MRNARLEFFVVDFASIVLIAALECNENVFVKIYIFVHFL